MDAVGCPQCHRVRFFDELKDRPGNSGPKPEGGTWNSTYYHCPDCNRVLVFDPGDGSPMRVTGGILVQSSTR